MNPSSVRLTIPERSATTPPLAANKYGMAMRIIWVRNESGFMRQMVGKAESACEASRVAPPARATQNAGDFGHGHRDSDDHYSLQHVHHLLRHEGVNGEAALRERGKKERRQQDAEWMVASDQRDGDAEEPGATGKSILIVVLVAEDVVDAADPRDRTREGERAQPDAADADAAVLCRVGLETDRAQLVPATRAKEIEPDRYCDEHRHDQREVGGGAVKRRIDIGEPWQHSGVDLGSVQSLR